MARTTPPAGRPFDHGTRWNEIGHGRFLSFFCRCNPSSGAAVGINGHIAARRTRKGTPSTSLTAVQRRGKSLSEASLRQIRMGIAQGAGKTTAGHSRLPDALQTKRGRESRPLFPPTSPAQKHHARVDSASVKRRGASCRSVVPLKPENGRRPITGAVRPAHATPPTRAAHRATLAIGRQG